MHSYICTSGFFVHVQNLVPWVFTAIGVVLYSLCAVRISTMVGCRYINIFLFTGSTTILLMRSVLSSPSFLPVISSVGGFIQTVSDRHRITGITFSRSCINHFGIPGSSSARWIDNTVRMSNWTACPPFWLFQIPPPGHTYIQVDLAIGGNSFSSGFCHS